jgi:hypothetical protein
MDQAVDKPVDEHELTGGNTTGVVRVGDTVHREAGPWTPTVQRLLAHVRARGMTEVPEARVDDGGAAELREHAAMYRADAERIAALVEAAERA